MLSTKQSIWTRSFLFAFLASLLVFTAFYLLLPTLPLYLVNTLSADTTSTGIVLAVYTITALIIRPFTGHFIDTRGRKLVYLIGLFGFALLFGGYLLASTLAWLILVRMIHGLFWGITTTAGSTIAVDLIPSQRRGEGLGLFGLASTIPMAIGPVIGLLLVRGTNYNFVFIASILLSLVGWFLASRIDIPHVQRSNAVLSWKSLVEKSSLPVAAILFLNMITYGGVVSFISLYVKTSGVGDAGLFFLVYAIGIAISRLTSGRFFDRSGPTMLTVAAFIMVIAGFLLLSLWKHPAGFFLAAVSMGLGGGVLFPTFQAMVNNLVPSSRRGAANSTLFTILDMGIGLGMIMTGYLAGRLGLDMAFLYCSLLNVAALLLFLLYPLKHYEKNKLTPNKGDPSTYI